MSAENFSCLWIAVFPASLFVCWSWEHYLTEFKYDLECDKCMITLGLSLDGIYHRIWKAVIHTLSQIFSNIRPVYIQKKKKKPLFDEFDIVGISR